MGILESYKKLTRNSVIPTNSITTHIPNPNTRDYEKGYITRYFTQNATDTNSAIFEISANTFTNIQNNPMYVSVSLKWRITGPKETTYREDGQVLDMNVSESNRRAILLHYDKIPNLKMYLPNLLQFWK
jgi:hypothetical protein